MLSLLHIDKYLNILLLNPTCLTLYYTINSSIFHKKGQITLLDNTNYHAIIDTIVVHRIYESGHKLLFVKIQVYQPEVIQFFFGLGWYSSFSSRYKLICSKCETTVYEF